ncbi:MAG: hypothetical protein GY772_03585 [bacterium]|jgi:hypothetical protein|nr:hypothetical protein [Deltaproteobacteria bacterium]MCP4239622.1 hypothetical protein [bacterium]MDP7074705.1 hypothetical protein [Myxococcota bacterium]MDP7297973.1 hypothetical protein [Myxococcota bacterium]HJO23051.1 hypothetical protein [Myxococcota bacterium]
MTNPIGQLVAEDERFNHQVADTFATVGTSDPSWTEKVCAMAMARDGSLQIGLGLGKYTNRNVIDAYCALSRGKEQLTVRASRSLATDPENTIIGPIRYEVVEPLKKVRFRLEPNDCQPIAFDWLFEAAVPPFLEERTHLRAQFRVMSELVRYHQTGVASGWIELDGERYEINPDSWVSTRDHSWGVRYDVGVPPSDLEARPSIPPGVGFMMIWCPVLMERRDGSRYALHLHFTRFEATGFQQKMVTARVEHPDGSEEVIADIDPDLHFDPNNRRLLGGSLRCTMADGKTRKLEIEVLGDTGVHLGAGLYFGLDGHHHGEWRGEFHLDGERIGDCTTPEQARRLHQIRDTAVRVVDTANEATGFGNCQPIAAGPWPELGLENDSWM